MPHRGVLTAWVTEAVAFSRFCSPSVRFACFFSRSMNSTDARVEEIAKRQQGLISWKQLQVLRISRHQVRRRVRTGRWFRELPGVWRMSWAEPSWIQKVWCAALWAGPGTCLSHRTAAKLWDLDASELDKVELTGETRRRKHRDWLVCHRTAPIPRQMQRIRKGVPLTSPARTLVDLGAVCDDVALEQAMEHAFRRRISSVNEVHHALRWLPNEWKPGTRRVARVLEQGVFSPKMHSELERQALRLFRRLRLPEPICQYEVAADDLVLGFVDFAWPKAKVIVEAEGFEFHSGREVWESDIDRYNAMTLRGWKVLRLTHSDLQDPSRPLFRELKALLLGPSRARSGDQSLLLAGSTRP